MEDCGSIASVIAESFGLSLFQMVEGVGPLVGTAAVACYERLTAEFGFVRLDLRGIGSILLILLVRLRFCYWQIATTGFSATSKTWKN
jgi:hypothetical protein